MNTKHDLANRIQRVYLTLQAGNTLAASFNFGINTLFLLDAGLSKLEVCSRRTRSSPRGWCYATSRPGSSPTSGDGGRRTCSAR